MDHNLCTTSSFSVSSLSMLFSSTYSSCNSCSSNKFNSLKAQLFYSTDFFFPTSNSFSDGPFLSSATFTSLASSASCSFPSSSSASFSFPPSSSASFSFPSSSSASSSSFSFPSSSSASSSSFSFPSSSSASSSSSFSSSSSSFYSMSCSFSLSSNSTSSFPGLSSESLLNSLSSSYASSSWLTTTLFYSSPSFSSSYLSYPYPFSFPLPSLPAPPPGKSRKISDESYKGANNESKELIWLKNAKDRLKHIHLNKIANFSTYPVFYEDLNIAKNKKNKENVKEEEINLSYKYENSRSDLHHKTKEIQQDLNDVIPSHDEGGDLKNTSDYMNNINSPLKGHDEEKEEIRVIRHQNLHLDPQRISSLSQGVVQEEEKENVAEKGEGIENRNEEEQVMFNRNNRIQLDDYVLKNNNNNYSNSNNDHASLFYSRESSCCICSYADCIPSSFPTFSLLFDSSSPITSFSSSPISPFLSNSLLSFPLHSSTSDSNPISIISSLLHPMHKEKFSSSSSLFFFCFCSSCASNSFSLPCENKVKSLNNKISCHNNKIYLNNCFPCHSHICTNHDFFFNDINSLHRDTKHHNTHNHLLIKCIIYKHICNELNLIKRRSTKYSCLCKTISKNVPCVAKSFFVSTIPRCSSSCSYLFSKSALSPSFGSSSLTSSFPSSSLSLSPSSIFSSNHVLYSPYSFSLASSSCVSCNCTIPSNYLCEVIFSFSCPIFFLNSSFVLSSVLFLRNQYYKRNSSESEIEGGKKKILQSQENREKQNQKHKKKIKRNLIRSFSDPSFSSHNLFLNNCYCFYFFNFCNNSDSYNSRNVCNNSSNIYANCGNLYTNCMNMYYNTNNMYAHSNNIYSNSNNMYTNSNDIYSNSKANSFYFKKNNDRCVDTVDCNYNSFNTSYNNNNNRHTISNTNYSNPNYIKEAKLYGNNNINSHSENLRNVIGNNNLNVVNSIDNKYTMKESKINRILKSNNNIFDCNYYANNNRNLSATRSLQNIYVNNIKNQNNYFIMANKSVLNHIQDEPGKSIISSSINSNNNISFSFSFFPSSSRATSSHTSPFFSFISHLPIPPTPQKKIPRPSATRF